LVLERPDILDHPQACEKNTAACSGVRCSLRVIPKNPDELRKMALDEARETGACDQCDRAPEIAHMGETSRPATAVHGPAGSFTAFPGLTGSSLRVRRWSNALNRCSLFASLGRRTTTCAPRDTTCRIHLSGVGEFLHGIKQQTMSRSWGVVSDCSAG